MLLEWVSATEAAGVGPRGPPPLGPPPLVASAVYLLLGLGFHRV